ncbi:pilus assembly protein [Vibrio europaeus]|uniref:TadE family protein n=1 Tax=Vibrio europaeus TaxID=300876 RepID=UPI00233F3740|nr:TadE family protein [Vibrio europaeus]MDC5721483.1 pilus assembly protein [Vibrio europaeus]MDC5754064.1 pilus assembly protein [Vibrio europaeus]MDC5776976.1 pilus assembly protein [Vibrio europaeus]MDC5796992.1 pilus assembly protein [Vibrio europaeus]MDC5801989.1 pilus assembly protein [Vibrio europaeus]
MTPKSSVRGVVSIEFALSFLALWLVTILVMDIGLQNYSTSVVNFAVSESARDVKVRYFKTEKEFEQHFRHIIDKNHFSLWGFLLNKGSVSVDIKRYANLKALAQQQISSSVDPKVAPIARYQVTYTYRPLLGVSLMPTHEVVRSVISVQEGAKHV